MKIERVLVVDDDPLTRDFITECLEMRELTVYTASCGKDALAILKEQSIDLLVTDMHMPHMSGLELIEKMRKVSPATLAIVITAYGSIDNAVDAMRLGAFNYILKPFTADTVSAFLEKADEHFSLVQENIYLKESLYPNSSKEERALIGESAVMKEIIATCKKVAESNASVFIHGESGTGKEVIAQLIHSFSPRADNPFIKVNCAAIAETLIESEFFGHEKGAFTGANAKRAGRFELASGGTLLLDEISEIPPGLQAKLLRVTQEMEFERVGGTKPIKVDVRLISTSNREVRELLEQKIMREDLFYRLNVIPIYLPPLRERREDIIPLAKHFLKLYCAENHKAQKTLSKEAGQKLLSYDWPGNIRELGNIIERAVVTMEDEEKTVKPENIYLDTLGHRSKKKASKDLASRA